MATGPQRSASTSSRKERAGGSAPVPVSVRVDVERREDDREDALDVLADEVDDVLVVPVVQRSFGDLLSPSVSSLFLNTAR